MLATSRPKLAALRAVQFRCAYHLGGLAHNMFGPFTDPRVAVEIGQVFGRASERIRERRERSMEREADGNRGRREDSDTDDLIHDFETEIAATVAQVDGNALGQSNARMQIEFYPTNLPVKEEHQFGADFGVRLHVAYRGFNITKGVLFQSKRMYGPASEPTFDQLRGDGETQAERMLSVTPASFFLLFTGTQVGTAMRWLKWPAAWWPFHEFGPLPGPFPEHLYMLRHEPGFSLWNPGVLVLPASRVYAESRSHRKEGRPLPVTARHWAQASIPLGVFMADLLGACFVGDVRDDVVRLVTPPRLRDLANTGLADFDASRFPVRRLMNISVQSDETRSA